MDVSKISVFSRGGKTTTIFFVQPFSMKKDEHYSNGVSDDETMNREVPVVKRESGSDYSTNMQIDNEVCYRVPSIGC